MAETLASILNGLNISTRNDFENLLRLDKEISALQVINLDNAKKTIGIEYDQEEGRIYKKRLSLRTVLLTYQS